MRECLRKVSQCIAGVGVDLFGKQAEIVVISQRLFKLPLGFRVSSSAERQILSCPKAADAERAFRRLPLISVDQTTVRSEFGTNAGISPLHALGIRRLEPI